MSEELNQESVQPAEEAPKPKRRTTRAKKAEVAEVPAEDTSKTEQPVAKKSTARRSSTRKSAPAPETVSEQTEATKTAEDTTEATETTAAPKATPKRAPRKRTAKSAEAQESAPETVQPAESVAETVAPAPASEEAQGASAKRTTRRKRTVKIQTELPPAPEAVAVAEPAEATPVETAPAVAEEHIVETTEADQKSEDQKSDDNSSSKKNKKKQPAPQQNQGKNKNQNQSRRQRRQHGGNREVLPSISRDEFAEMKVGDLREKAAEYGIDGSKYRKAELIDVVFEALCKAEGIIEVVGILDIMNDGYGFLRTKGYLPSESDAYVSLSIIRRNSLRKGDFVAGLTRPPQNNEKYAAIQKVISVNDIPIDELGGRARFADLTPVYPDERLVLEHGKNTTTARVMDLVSPIGKGQRGLIVSPPKAGKTTVLKDIAASITANNPEVHLMCLLVDERPEEVTDMERSIKGEVISSTFDMPCENHIAVAELVIERAKRLVEQGRDVVILLDSITRLARAYNMGTPASGRILSGGVDSSALYPPKRFLGAARNIEFGGSLTILGTALVDTGSKMDEVIFEEFKGTGNMEVRLDRSLADRRIFPAIDPISSGTRKEELLLNPQEAPLIWAVRRVLANLNNTERAMDTLVKSLKQTDSNQEFLIRFARKAQTSNKPEDGLVM